MQMDDPPKRSRARGRIAEVLAQARASLKEPSRPFTPASLDQRTSLSLSANIKSLDKHGRIAASRASVDRQLHRRAEGSRTRSYEELDTSSTNRVPESENNRGTESSNTNDADDAEHVNVPERRRSVQSTSRAAASSSTSFSRSTDVLDAVRYLGGLLSSSDNIDTDALLLFNVRSLKEIVLSSFDSVERIAKFLKSDEANDQNVIKEVLGIIEEFFYYLSDDDKIDSDNGDKNENEFTRKLTCRLILRLSVSILSRSVFLNSVAASSSSLKKDAIPNTFLQAIKTMFRHLKIEIENKNMVPGNTSIFIENKIPQQHQTFLKEKEKKRKEDVLQSYGAMSDLLRDFIFQHSIDLLLEFQTTFCILMPNLGLRLIHLKNENSESSCGNNGHNNNNNYERKEKEKEKEQEIFELIEIAIFSAGILRHHSSDDVNRRKLSHLHLVENIAELLRSLGSFTVSCQKEKAFNAEKNRKGMVSRRDGEEMDGLLDRMVEKISQIVVQLVVVIRNYSLDVSGRLQLQNTKIVSLLCSLLKPFKGFPELSLNCVRVTAKLTLQDSFRMQINSKAAHIRCLIEVLMLQGGCCQRVMEGGRGQENGVYQFVENSGDGSNEANRSCNNSSDVNDAKDNKRTSRLTIDTERETEEEKDETEAEGTWPYWYTWPLISRVAFTLGNLTTSNNVNRVLIGLESESLPPILSLLQACAGSLNQLYCGSPGSIVKSEGKEVEDSDEDEDEDDYSRGAIGQELSDATVKLLRLLANLAIEEKIGARLALMPETLQMLIELTTCSSRVSTATEERTGEEEELLLNTVAACTNITFYACKDLSDETKEDDKKRTQNTDLFTDPYNPPRSSSSSPMRCKAERQLVSLSGCLAHCLFHENEEVVLESARALGNLTRNRAVSRSLITSRIDEALLLLLAHTHPDIVSAVSGALVNLSGDPEWKATYRTERDYEKASPFPSLLGVLRRSNLKDIELSTLICQILHNLLLSDGSDDTPSLLHRPPPLLTTTLTELVECSDDMAQEYNSLNDRNKDKDKQKNKDRNKGRDKDKDGNIATFESVFNIPRVELSESDKTTKKYSDFSSVARAVLLSILRLETS